MATPPTSVRSGSRHSSLRIVAVATAFNLLFEYSLRGVNHLAEKPFFVLILAAAYGSLFTMEEDLIRRFRLKDYHLLVLAFTYGMIYQGLVSGTAFENPGPFGVHWSHSLFVLIVWWGCIQSVFTFYVANRLCPRRWDDSALNIRGWALALFVNLLVIGLFQTSGKIPRGQPAGYLMMAVVASTAALFLTLLLKTRANQLTPFRRHRFLDLIAASTIAMLFLSAFLTNDPTKYGASDINRTAVHVVVAWTLITALALLAFRLKTGREIPV